jgi:hypothetical protein
MVESRVFFSVSIEPGFETNIARTSSPEQVPIERKSSPQAAGRWGWAVSAQFLHFSTHRQNIERVGF